MDKVLSIHVQNWNRHMNKIIERLQASANEFVI